MDAVNTGAGKLLANAREIPASALTEAEKILQSIIDARVGGIAQIGEPGMSVLKAPVDTGKVGVVVYAGVNAMAAVEETGIRVNTYPISTITDFKELKKLE